MKNKLSGLRVAISNIRHVCWLFPQFFNSVRLWDFIENRESQHVPSTEDVDMTELGDLFMHLSGVESSEP